MQQIYVYGKEPKSKDLFVPPKTLVLHPQITLLFIFYECQFNPRLNI